MLDTIKTGYSTKFIYSVGRKCEQRIAISLVFACMLSVISFIYAENDYLAFLGHNEENPFHVMDVEIVGDRAYIANGLGQGLEVYDISDPAHPVRLSGDGPSAWRCQSFGDTLLAVFARRDGVKLYDISSGNLAVPLGQYNPSQINEALEGGVLVGDTLYCTAHQNGIYLLDITDPLSPQKVGEFPLDSSAAWNAVVADSFLLVANGRFGLSILGLEGNVHEVAHLPLTGLANDINLDDTIAVISLGAGGLATVNIADPYNPQILDTMSSDGNVFGSGIAHNFVVSGSWFVMELFDISDPSNITRRGWENTKTWAMGADIRDDSLIVVGDWRGISCYTVSADQGPDIDVYPEILGFWIRRSVKRYHHYRPQHGFYGPGRQFNHAALRYRSEP